MFPEKLSQDSRAISIPTVRIDSPLKTPRCLLSQATQIRQITMSSSMSSSLSPSEEAYNTAEEDHHSYAQASSEASSTITTTLDGGSDSVYITANQTPTASPDVDRFSISLGRFPFFLSISAKHKLAATLDQCCDHVFLLNLLSRNDRIHAWQTLL